MAFRARKVFRTFEKQAPDLCDPSAVLYQFSYHANWEQVVVWVDHKPVDVEIEDDNTWKIPVLSLS